MKCYLLMNLASKRNSTSSLKVYEKLCPHDDHSCSTCVRITKLNKRALGKVRTPAKMTEEAFHLFQNSSSKS